MSYNKSQKSWWCQRFGWHPFYDCSEKRGTIEIAIWHKDRSDASRVIKEYAEAAVRAAWGDEYSVEVWLARQDIPNGLSDDEIFGWVRDDAKKGYGYKAKDANLICLDHTDAVGGGSVCKFSVDTPFDDDPDVDDLWVTPNSGKPLMKVEKYACGKPYNLISSAIHEMGHCLGLGHDVGGYVSHNGKKYASPMPYLDGDCYYLRYSDEAEAKKPSVQ